LPSLDLRIATLNIGGGEKSFEEFPNATQKSRQEALAMVIRRLDATVLCLQEVSEFVDAEGLTHSLLDGVNKAGGYDYSFYGETLSMQTHMQVKKDVMVKGVFNDWWNWSKGNAIHSRIPFSRLSVPDRPGIPRNIPLYQPTTYEGTRDTDPRFALLTRLKEPPYPFIVTLHLSTLIGERGEGARPSKLKQAQSLRGQQINRLLDLVRVHILKANEPIILTGDFNAMADEPCMLTLLNEENGFVRLVPEIETPSHPKVSKPIDHIFFYPAERLLDYRSRVSEGDLSRRASDHLPVVADLKIS
jgi:endonuclease/exonuclease/phosphatase family metal-dependent hydrolase